MTKPSTDPSSARAACKQPIPILTYHQIAPLPSHGTPFRHLTVAPGRFARQMAALKRMGYTGLSMQDLRPYLLGERHGKVVGLTFDDGYCNVVDHALPVLARYGYTATSYMVAGQIGGHNAWDTGAGIGAAPLVDVARMRDWIAGGNEIGSHTIDHVNLRNTADNEARRQIAGSRDLLQDALGVPVQAFCFPYGFLHDTHVEMAREAGYRDATTTHPGRARAGADMLRLPRIMMHSWSNFATLVWQMSTPFEDVRGWQRALRRARRAG